MRWPNLKHTFLLLFVVLFSWTTAACSQLLNKESVLSQLLYRDLSQYHFSQNKIDDAFSAKAYNSVFEDFDPGKRIFTQDDVTALSKYKFQLDDDFKLGNRIFFDQFYSLYRQHLTQLGPIISSLLKTPFPLVGTGSIELDPKKREFPASQAELRQAWKAILAHQYLTNYLLFAQEKYGTKNIEAHLNKADPALEKKSLAKVVKDTQNWLKNLQRDSKKVSLERYFDILVKQWDPHTNYLAPAEKENFDISMTGTVEGIGATLKDEDGFIKVVSVVVGGPAWRQKDLKANDVILKVAQGSADSVDISGMQVNDAVKLIRGKKGSLVRLTVRKANGEIKVIQIQRDIVVLDDTYAKSAIVSPMGSQTKYGYIYLPVFYHNFSDRKGRSAAEDVHAEILKLNKAGISGLILDLRNNSGGALDDAVKLSGLFIPKGPIVQVKQGKFQAQVLEDVDPGVDYNGPLIVMINEWSASASEIVAAALQDYGRAIIVGSVHSYGKGTVQTLIPLDDELDYFYSYAKPLGSLKLTIQKFYRINGGATQFKGVLSDIVLPDTSQDVTAGERTLTNALPWDTIKPVVYAGQEISAQKLDLLRSKSAHRVQADPLFKKIALAASMTKTFQDHTSESLSLPALWGRQNVLKRTQKEITDLTKPALSLASSEPVSTVQELKAKQDEWFKTLSKDVYLKESLHILEDMTR